MTKETGSPVPDRKSRQSPTQSASTLSGVVRPTPSSPLGPTPDGPTRDPEDLYSPNAGAAHTDPESPTSKPTRLPPPRESGSGVLSPDGVWSGRRVRLTGVKESDPRDFEKGP